jgi:histidyl-tRNA synthetase
MADPLLAVVPDRPELDGHATAVTAQLRARGLAVTRAFRGNAKRQTELARKQNADAILFVRSSDGAPDSLHLSMNAASTIDADDLRVQVFDALQPLVSGRP